MATGRSRFQVYRDFQTRYGMAPSTYLCQVRLRAARRLLAAGEPPARVATAVGRRLAPAPGKSPRLPGNAPDAATFYPCPS